MPNVQSRESRGFRFAAKKVGLTWSCPITCGGTAHTPGCECENPLKQLWDSKSFIEAFNDWGAVVEWVVGKEHHADGKLHFHAYVKFNERLDTLNARFFDLLGVHPNIINNPGRGWIAYCVKDKEYATNFYQRDPFAAAFEMSPETGLNHLRTTRPRDVALHGQNISLNLRANRRRRVGCFRVIYYGPYVALPETWMKNKTLVMVSKPGWGKTQMACYWALHLFDSYFYCKGSMECLRHYAGQSCIIYDDIKVDNYRNEWDDVFDVESGGMFAARYKDIEIPAVPKMWLMNPGVVVPDPFGRIFELDRRAQVFRMD